MTIYHRLLIPLDEDGCTRSRFDTIAALARDQAACVKLVTVVDVDAADYLGSELAAIAPELIDETLVASARETLTEAAARLRDRGIRTETELLISADGSIDNPLLSAAKRWRADLIILASHGYQGLSLLLHESITERLLENLRLPILILPCKNETE